jgi:pyruvate dehydrogenase E1 component alpha subunit
MEPDLLALYTQMLRSRLLEEAVAELWQLGLISGEMHLNMGEEAIVAGVVDHLGPGDALAADHRGTAPLLMHGVDPVPMLREFLGRADGMCGGRGGHMHLYSPQHLAATSGIVGASGPTAVGFALAAVHLRPETVAVAFFGEGATNQGHLLEAMNLASVWRLPVLFVCKDNDWAITTPSRPVLGGQLVQRARGFGLDAMEVNGTDVGAVWQAARQAVARARAGEGPTFLHAHCLHLEGHFLGDLLLRVTRHPVREMLAKITPPLLRSMLRRRGAPRRERARSQATILGLIARTRREQANKEGDPIRQARRRLDLDGAELLELEETVAREIGAAVEQALEPVSGPGEDGR